jgi:DNA repair photolyase
LPRVEIISRKGPVLHASPLGEQGEVLGLNLTRGCVHRCAFCSARAYPTYPGDGVVYLFADTAQRLEAELSRRSHRPRAVHVCPATDPFPPLPEIQAEATRVVEVLAAQGVEAWLMTRGSIRPAALGVLAACRERVRVTVGLTTLDRALQRSLEPLAAPPRLRLRQIARLRDLGIAVQVALDPLVPGLTDTRANMAPLFEALAALGIRQVTASYMFLRPGIRDNLVSALEPLGWADPVLEEFEGGPVLAAGTIAPARYLPKIRRQRGYAALMALAAGYGLAVRVCGTTNPDFGRPRGTAGPCPRLLPQV